MAFKKYNPHLIERLNELHIDQETPFQKKILSSFKSGANIYGIGSDGIGKTTSMIIGTLQKLNCEAFEDAPRALILVKDKQAALDLEAAFKIFTRRTDLRIYSAFEDPKIRNQIDSIYIGVDIVIATPKHISKIYFLNGINLSQLQLFIIDDAEFLSKTNVNTEIIRLTESIKKCQFLIYANQLDAKSEKFRDSFMRKSILIK
jgi:superfamily II DNA/RNA helicase